MTPTNWSHRWTHNILLISRLLNQREGASPFTLVLDNLEQSAKPLLREYVRRAHLSKTHVIFLSFETPRSPAGVDDFIPCWNKAPQKISQAASAAVVTAQKRCLLLIDSLMSLSSSSTQQGSAFDLTGFLMSLLQPPQSNVTLVAVYHFDIPVHNAANPYAPSPLSLLLYLATTVMKVHSLAVLLADKQARERSLGAPRFGLAEEKEGVLIGLKTHIKQLTAEERGLVIQLEHRRKSGRGVLEWYFLPELISTKAQSGLVASKEPVVLLVGHPLFTKRHEQQSIETDLAGVTFELSLTDRQRLERDGVVLPYFDAQKSGGGGEGGRILYDMGEEDDFDEEDDEI